MPFHHFGRHFVMGLVMLIGSAVNAQSLGGDALKPSYGMFPAENFQTTTGQCQDCSAIPQALWYFRDETIAVPKNGQPIAGFDRAMSIQDDLTAWAKATPVGSAAEYPPLIWIAAPDVLRDVRIAPDGRSVKTANGNLALQLVPKLPLNGSYFDAHSLAFFQGKLLKLRGWQQGDKFVAQVFWSETFRLPQQPSSLAIKADPAAFREWIRALPQGGAQSPFLVESIWRRAESSRPLEGQPIIGLMLNGSQGDDDEAQGGHFGIMAGRIGANGAMDDWLVNNIYSLDSISEKGIIAAAVPLDNYLGDLNSGQAWYRPSYMLVATLKDARTATYFQSAFGRVFNQFYRHQFDYQHARANCAGTSVLTARALGWQVPVHGVEGWLKAIFALPYVAITERSLSKGKAVFDYMTEDQTKLSPGVAFAEMGADLMKLAAGQSERSLSPFERLLAEDVEEILLVRVPQLPSSRAWGNFPIENTGEYMARLPKDPADQKIIPVPPRLFPAELRDAKTPSEPFLHSDYAVIGWALAILALCLFILRRLLA